MMKKLLSLPPNLVGRFHEITGHSTEEWFCSNDPVGSKLGSGGGTVWLLWQAYRQMAGDAVGTLPAIGQKGFESWLASEKRILLHAGGQSRRLPAYAPSGKVLTPVPVFRWERGQRLSQDLLSLQMPLYERIMAAAPDNLHTMVVSGDVYIRATEKLPPVPQADVVCYGLWLNPDVAKNHGVFVSSRRNPTQLEYMLQKPSVEQLANLRKAHYFLTDIGIWLLSDRAVEVLMRRSLARGASEVVTEAHHADGTMVGCYDLYAEFGGALGTDPTCDDPEVNALSVAVLPLPAGQFYHFGTSHELLSSTVAIQNLVSDQRQLLHRDRKPHPSIFVQNAETWVPFTEDNQNLWIENACVSEQWTLAQDNIITGVPQNDWKIKLIHGQCIDVVPVGESEWVVRPYGYQDTFRGPIDHPSTLFLGQPLTTWLSARGLSTASLMGGSASEAIGEASLVVPDIQSAPLFPVVSTVGDIGLVLRWMLNEPEQQGGKMLWESSRRMSADDISNEANLSRLTEQRRQFRAQNWPFLAKNHAHSVFYQVDLEDAAREFVQNHIALPHALNEDEPLLTRVHDAMFRYEVGKQKGEPVESFKNQAFSLLREGLTTPLLAARQQPRQSVYADQIVWGRSPVRIDLAGGWTDTPPYCLMEGGQVLNIAIELNGQPPLQAYVKPCKEMKIMMRSIDLGASETVTTYEQLSDFRHVGGPFSIAKAALVLAGFQPGFSQTDYPTLEEQLQDFGCGIEITQLSAIPAGSGLGTSSLLAATILGALSNFCGLGWDRNEVGRRTLVLEQLLTTGGGWQDQFGGLLQGVKLLQTQRGFGQQLTVKWLPTDLFVQPEYRSCHLLYYTGITRTAKDILEKIVRRMFLNHGGELSMLRDMKAHALDLYETIQRNDFSGMGKLVRKTWMQNQMIDSGTNPPEVDRLTRLVDDLCLGYKLPGAGGGGYLYMIAKDPEAAGRIKQILADNRLHTNARFVDMGLSTEGMQVSRS